MEEPRVATDPDELFSPYQAAAIFVAYLFSKIEV
jgi:hypothetical protein